MDVLLVRHGKAQNYGRSGDDHGRPLTEKGWQQSQAVGRLLRRMRLVPDLVLTSPRKRAYETGKGLMAELGQEGSPVIEEWLNFDLNPVTVLHELGALPEEIQRVVLVGHEPTFSSLVTWLLKVGSGYIEVKKASIVHLQLSPPSQEGALLKMVVPIRALLEESSV